MNSKNNPVDISYFRLSLLDFLRESHPKRLPDEPFISARSEAAAETYAQAAGLPRFKSKDMLTIVN
jgi:hypothetical protein